MKFTNPFAIVDCPRHLRPEPFNKHEPDPPLPPAKVPTYPGKPTSHEKGTLAPNTPKEPGFVQDARGHWLQYAHPSNNLTRDQFPYCTTYYLAGKRPESTFKYLWRRGSFPAKYDAEGYDAHAAKNALYKRHRALKKAEKDFAKYEKKMVKNKHVDYTPLAERAARAEKEDGGDGYRAPPAPSGPQGSQNPQEGPSSQQNPQEGPSNPPRYQSVPPPYPDEAAELSGKKPSTSEETKKSNRKAHRKATLHGSEAVSSGTDIDGHREEGARERRKHEIKDDAPVIPAGR